MMKILLKQVLRTWLYHNSCLCMQLSNTIKHFWCKAEYSNECPLQMPIRLKPLHLCGKHSMKICPEEDQVTDDNRIFPFTGSYFLFIEALESWCIFWGSYYYFIHMTGDYRQSNSFLIYLKSLCKCLVIFWDL